MRPFSRLLLRAAAMLAPLGAWAQTEVEPNDNTGSATAMSYNTPMAGSIGACSPTNTTTDYFTFTPTQHGQLRIQTTMSNSGISDLNVSVVLRNNANAILQTFTATAGANNVPTDNTFLFTCAGLGVYYISIPNPGGTVCTNYSLTYDVQSPLFGADAEPNQGTGAAIVTTAGSDYDGHVEFNYDDDFDYYRLQAPTDGVLNVTFAAENAGPSTGTLTLYLRNSANGSLHQWTANVGANGSPATNTFTHTCTGTEGVYYLEPDNPTVCGVSYRFSYTVTPPVYGDDAEPNQGTGSAVEANVGTDYDGRLDFEYDNNFDYFKIQAPNDGVLSVSIYAENAGPTVGTMSLYLRNSSNGTEELWAVNVGANGSPVLNSFTHTCTGTEGVYYLEPFSPSVCGVSYRFNYTVAAPVFAADAEPNQGTGAAIPIDLANAPADGHLDFDYDNDFDYYRITHAGGPIVVYSSAENAGASGTMSIYVRNSANGQVLLNNAVAVGGNGVPALDTTTTAAQPAGTYYIETYSPTLCGVSVRLKCYDDDNDGVCNGSDLCANTPSGEGVNSNGCSCSQVTVDDGDVCTLDECLNGDVTHTFQDADADLTCDANDGCPNDPNKVAPGQCGCGVADTDTDGDLTADCNDGCPNDANKTAPGVCGCGVADTDTDGDLTADCNDGCPNDANKVAPGTCGCGNPEPGTPCDDGNAGTFGDAINGSCVCVGSPVNCDDGDPCTVDSFDGIQCVHTPIVCDDSDPCTIDACVGGVCQYTPIVCDDSDPCTTDACVGGVCVFTPIVCDDSDPCTTDACVGGVCVFTPIVCDDSDPCTTDACVGGVCVFTPIVCDDSDPCTTDACVAGVCVFTPIVCDDSDPCTTDACVSGVCVYTPIVCDDSDACTTDACVGGVCVYTPVVCDDSDPCTTDACVGGVCQYTPLDCDDGDPNTVDACVGGICTHTPIGSCTSNDISLELLTDANGAQTSWQITALGTGTVVCNGPSASYGNGTLVTEHCCLPDGCYELKVFDSFGDGMTTGGYRLKDQNGKRIVDNWNDGAFGTLSTIASNTGFCLDLGTDQLASSSCDQETLAASSVIVAMENTSVTAQFGITNATSGYQFQIFNPDGGYLRNIFQNMTTGAGTGAQRSRSLLLGSIVSNPIPATQLLNVRVRARVDGANNTYGPVCRMRIAPPPPCTTTQLDNDPLHTLTYSCGVMDRAVGGAGNTNKIHAIPVAGATHYKFRLQSGTYVRNIVVNSTTLVLGLWSTNPLLCGLNTYNVQVAASVDGGLTYCPFGSICSVGINNPGGAVPCTSSSALQALNEGVTTSDLRLWPNPNRGDRIHVTLTGIDASVTEVNMEVTDLFGKRVIGGTVVTGGGDLNHVMELGNIASGVYTVTVTAGDVIKTQRLVVQ